MNRFTLERLGGAIAVLSLALAACSLIPPQNIGDVFGMDGTEVTVSEPAAGLRVAQFTDGCDDGTHCAPFGPATFADPEISGIATSIIAGFDVDAGIEATITAPGAVAERITVSSFGVSLTVSDQETDQTVSASASATADPAIVFERTSVGVYVADDVSDLQLTVEFDGSELGTLKEILTGGGQNVGSGVVYLNVEEQGIASMTITLQSEGATVSF
ncbi:MAG: hypothetical protein U5J97_01040 [Trueperaceae bacterium]|nr:hypothetical protein [Trueperaceae bacterium]